MQPSPGSLALTALLHLIAGLAAPVFAATGAQPPSAPPDPQTAPAAPSIPTDRVERWKLDIDHLVTELPARHKNAFFKITREEWLSHAQTLRSRLPDLTDDQIVVAVRQLVARLGDAHTLVWIDRESLVPQVHPFPLGTVWASDGIFASVLPKQHEALLTRRLIAIDGMPIDDAVERLATLRAFDNQSGKRTGVMQDIRDAESLAALGIIKDPTTAAFTFAPPPGSAPNEPPTTITLRPLTARPSPSDIAQRPDPAAMPIGRRMPREPFGAVPLPAHRAFYIWYDTCADQPNLTVADFIKQTLAALDAELAKEPPAVTRVIIDLRRNGGGNSALFVPMISALASRDALKQPGAIAALIGRRTFSSGMLNAGQLRSGAKAFLVGEPTGGTPNGFGEVRQFRLPASKLQVQYSTKLFGRVGPDPVTGEPPADALYPDVAVEQSAEEFFSSRDTVLDTALTCEPPPPPPAAEPIRIRVPIESLPAGTAPPTAPVPTPAPPPEPA